MTTITPERDRLMRDLMMVCAGHPAEVAFYALEDTLASVIGLMATDRRSANAVADKVPADLKQTLRENWDYLSEMRASAAVNRGGGRS